MTLIKERMPAGLLGLLGVLLAIPTLFLPTARLTVSRERNGESQLLQQTTTWSSGKSGSGAVAGLGEGTVREAVVNNWPGLVVLVLLVVLGLVAALAWLTRPGIGAVVLGAIGLAALAGRTISVTAVRMGYVETGSSSSSIKVERPFMIGGLFETLSAACLLAALVLLALGISSISRAAIQAGATTGAASVPSAPAPVAAPGFTYPSQPAGASAVAAQPGPAASGPMTQQTPQQAPAPDFAPKPPRGGEPGN